MYFHIDTKPKVFCSDHFSLLHLNFLAQKQVAIDNIFKLSHKCLINISTRSALLITNTAPPKYRNKWKSILVWKISNWYLQEWEKNTLQNKTNFQPKTFMQWPHTTHFPICLRIFSADEQIISWKVEVKQKANTQESCWF